MLKPTKSQNSSSPSSCVVAVVVDVVVVVDFAFGCAVISWRLGTGSETERRSFGPAGCGCLLLLWPVVPLKSLVCQSSTSNRLLPPAIAAAGEDLDGVVGEGAAVGLGEEVRGGATSAVGCCCLFAG